MSWLAPYLFSVTPGDRSVTFNWGFSPPPGNLHTDFFSVWSMIGSDSSTTIYNTVPLSSMVGNSFTYTSSNLTNGTEYTFTISAYNIETQSYSEDIITNATPGPPGPVGNFTATGGNSVVNFTWSAPSNTSISPITGYSIIYSDVSYSATQNPLVTLAASATSYQQSGSSVSNGWTYYYQIAAQNSVGLGPYSSASATPLTNPTIPQNFTGTGINGGVNLSWTPPSNIGALSIAAYNLQYSTDNATWSQSYSYSGTIFTIPFTGLTNGTPYYFQISAENNAGLNSTYTSISATPSTVPDAVVSLTPTSGNKEIMLSWLEPSYNGGAAITGYIINYNITGYSGTGPWSSLATLSVSALTNTITELTNGTTYYFQVAAVNISGTGTYTTTSATPSTVPGAVTSLVGTVVSTGIHLSWGEGSTGGSPISSYQVSYNTTSLSGQWSYITSVNASTISYLFTNVTSDIYQYYFKIVAVNSNGPSEGATTSVIIATAPTIPRNFTATGINGGVNLSWEAPLTIGALSITSYNLQYSTDPSVSWSQSYPYSGTTFTIPFTSLTNGTLYYFQILAGNNAGLYSEYTSTTATPSTIPDPPVITILDPYSNQTCILTWKIPDDGGSAITGYGLQHSTNSSGLSSSTVISYTPSPDISSPDTQLTYTFNNLTNDVKYYFQIAAINTNGSSYSNIVNDTPSVTSKPPSLITATAITSSSATITWTAPSLPITSGNPITKYYIQWTDVSSNSTNGDYSTTTTYVIPNLTYSTQYGIQISSINGSGIGALSNPPVYFTTLSNLPSVPTNLSITGCNTGYYNSIILKWNAPYDDGSGPITNYIIYYRPTDYPTTWNSYNTNSNDTTTIQKVPSINISYDFKVAAENSAGIGGFSSIISGSANNPPSPPMNLVASTTESGLIVLMWVPSVQTPPEYISYYFIEYKINSFGGWSKFNANIPIDVTEVVLDDPNIANNLLYLFRVYAVNSAGAQSDSSNIASAMSYNNSLPMYLWSRFSPNCGSNVTTATSPSTDNLEQKMLRKASVLQYFNIGALNFSTKQMWAMAARNQLTRKKGYATQTQDYTNANTTNMTNPTVPNIGLKEVNNILTCWTPQSTVICNPSSASNVPGQIKSLCFSLKAPYNNYRNPKTYGSGGTKLMLLF